MSSPTHEPADAPTRSNPRPARSVLAAPSLAASSLALLALTLAFTLLGRAADADPSTPAQPTATTPAPIADPALTKPPTLNPARFAFMAGRWVQEDQDAFVEETWSPPHGDSIVGMFRWCNGPKASMFELLGITAEPGKDGGTDVFLRLRHFSTKLEPWKSEPTALTLRYDAENSGPTQALFTAADLPEGATAGSLHSVRYSSPEPDRFDIVVSFDPASDRPPLRFNMKRAPSN